MNQRSRPGRRPAGVLLELFAASNRAGRLLREAMQASPLSPDEFALYSVLHASPGISPAAAAAILGVQRSTLSNYLKRMAGRGHLERDRHPSDGRSARLELSEPGRESVHRAQQDFGKAIAAVRQNLDTDPEQVLAVLRNLNRALDRAAVSLRAASRSPG